MTAIYREYTEGKEKGLVSGLTLAADGKSVSFTRQCFCPRSGARLADETVTLTQADITRARAELEAAIVARKESLAQLGRSLGGLDELEIDIHHVVEAAKAAEIGVK